MIPSSDFIDMGVIVIVYTRVNSLSSSITGEMILDELITTVISKSLMIDFT